MCKKFDERFNLKLFDSQKDMVSIISDYFGKTFFNCIIIIFHIFQLYLCINNFQSVQLKFSVLLAERLQLFTKLIP